jgi:hypothetical protein
VVIPNSFLLAKKDGGSLSKVSNKSTLQYKSLMSSILKKVWGEFPFFEAAYRGEAGRVFLTGGESNEWHGSTSVAIFSAWISRRR